MHRTTWLLLIAVAAACGGKDPVAPPPLPSDAPAADTADSGEDTPVFNPDLFFVASEFGVDQNTGEAVTSEAQSELGERVPLPIRLVLVLVDTSLGQGALTTENGCHFTLEVSNSLDTADWIDDTDGAWAAYEMPAAASVVADNPRIRDITGFDINACEEKEFGAEWGGDPEAQVTKWRWGMGLNAVNEDTLDILEYYIDPQQWDQLEPAVIGTGLWSDALLPFFDGGYIGDGYGWGMEVDEEGALVLDGTGNPKLIDSELIWLGSPFYDTGGLDTGMVPVADTFLDTAEPAPAGVAGVISAVYQTLSVQLDTQILLY